MLTFGDKIHWNSNRKDGLTKRPLLNLLHSDSGKGSCIGKELALMELKVVLIHLLRNFQILPVSKMEPLNFYGVTTLCPTNVKIQLERRQANQSCAMFNLPILLFAVLFYPIAESSNECQRRFYPNQTSFVCVCNSTYCNDVPEFGSTSKEEVIVYTTSLKSDRLSRTTKKFEITNDSKLRKDPSKIQLTVDPEQHHQKIIGFGGAITDASIVVFSNVSDQLKELLFNQYYGPSGISYNIGRVPIASCDFSLTNYSYLDTPDDFELKTFALNTLDFIRMDFLARAQNVSSPQLRLFSSPWSAPFWMKTSKSMQGGRLIDDDKIYSVYARYFVRFFEEYKKHGVSFWATTIENEPSMDGQVSWQSMAFDGTAQKNFIGKYLKPLMKDNWAAKDIKILAHDDFRGNLFWEALKYYFVGPDLIDGLAFHWYGGGHFDNVKEAHQLKPDKILLSSEACNAYAVGHSPELGSWEFGENYASDIINTLLNGANGWTDWNIWLDTQGGPNWVGNFVDSPIIVNATADEFYKQPMYFVMGHFSKFVLPDSVRIDLNADKTDTQLESIAFETNENNFIVVLLNKDSNRTFNLTLSAANKQNKQLNIELEPKSIKTLIWKK
ncbi:Glucosylceramidase [Aphelenchoides bicaudatus]|nr:Glucosylceramidase [Aphelenchoides bicaudatus]